MPGIRTFISFDTPPEISDVFDRIQDELKKSDADVRWETKNKFHVTIKFMGDTSESRLPDIISIIADSLKNYRGFEVIYQSLGCFPSRQRPRVVWAGCQNPDGILTQIKNSLDKGLLSEGFKIETRRFQPHITFGRVKSLKNIQNLIPRLESLNFEPRKASINEILLMKSILKPSGSEYSIIESIQLT